MATKTEIELKRLNLALKLAALGARPPVICAITNISRTRAIEIYEECTGMKTPKGRLLPENIDWALKSKQMNLQCSFIVAYYYRAISLGIEPAIALIKSYEAHFSHFPDTQQSVSFDRAWQVVQSIESHGSHTTTSCKHCHSTYIMSKFDLKDDERHCPVCHVRKKTPVIHQVDTAEVLPMRVAFGL